MHRSISVRYPSSSDYLNLDTVPVYIIYHLRGNIVAEDLAACRVNSTNLTMLFSQSRYIKHAVSQNFQAKIRKMRNSGHSSSRLCCREMHPISLKSTYKTPTIASLSSPPPTPLPVTNTGLRI